MWLTGCSLPNPSTNHGFFFLFFFDNLLTTAWKMIYNSHYQQYDSIEEKYNVYLGSNMSGFNASNLNTTPTSNLFYEGISAFLGGSER